MSLHELPFQLPSFRVLTGEPAMVCRMIFDELCVLANGDVVCSCGDPSGIRVYGNVHRDRVDDLYNGSSYREMRRWQLRGRPDSFCPVIGTFCGGRVSRATASDRETGRVVRMLQLEPISVCNLKCPSCPSTEMHFDPGYRDEKGSLLSLPAMLDVVTQLPELEKILFYNFGEPFLHPQAIPFLREVRRLRPAVTLHTSTNGLALKPSSAAALATEGLVDRIVFSIDGAFESSYRKYRVGGSLETALHALRSLVAARERSGAPFEIHWQYILFEWNDSDEELTEARRLATEIGVPLKWVFTHTAGASKTYRDGSAAAERLVGHRDPYASLTCDARMEHLWRHGGVALGRYNARLSLDRPHFEGVAGGRAPALLTVENRSSSDWRNESGGFRIGLKLRTKSGGVLAELPGVPLEPIKAGGRETVLLDITLPPAPFEGELFVDVVEDGICWFSDRSSAPLVAKVRSRAGERTPLYERQLATRAFELLLERGPDPEGLAYWTRVLATGRPLELFFRDMLDAAFAEGRAVAPGAAREARRELSRACS